MDFEPQKFFIGLVDFFSILLPGALLTYLLKDEAGPRIFGDHYQRFAGTEGWIVFLFTSYLVGHFIFLLGSWLLDDHVYDPMRTATYAEQIKRLAKGNDLSPIWARWLAMRFFKSDVDKTVRQAVKIKERYLDPLKASSAINAFQWCKARLTLGHPEAIATVQRLEADSKFFRSFVVVLCMLVFWALVMRRPQIALGSVISLILAFWRYVDQRVKSTSQAYWYIITLEGSSNTEVAQLPTHDAAEEFSHAGGVVSRRLGNRTEYLLVHAKKDLQEWVLPKGHIKTGEQMQETAVREVREETGVWARIKGELKDVFFSANGEQVKVRFFLMEALEEGKPTDRGREHTWLPLDQALSRTSSHKETQEVLRLAELQ
jgi:8-oxo-dGTP pyrophosphatase MutT (NUDIX family)